MEEHSNSWLEDNHACEGSSELEREGAEVAGDLEAGGA